MMNNSILSVRTTDLLPDALRYMKMKCKIDDNSTEGAGMYRSCMRIWADFFAGGQMDVLLSRFGRECIDVDEQRLKLDDIYYTCHLLEVMKADCVIGGVCYLFHAPEVDYGDMSQSERFYVESWQIALLDAMRLWLERFLRRQQPSGSYLSESFGPGFYGMDIGAVPKLAGQMQGEQVGIRVLPNGMMEPSMSLVGMFLTGSEPFCMPSGDCISCQGTGHCRMCRHFGERESDSGKK